MERGVSKYKFENDDDINLKQYKNLRVFDCSFTNITALPELPSGLKIYCNFSEEYIESRRIQE